MKPATLERNGGAHVRCSALVELSRCAAGRTEPELDGGHRLADKETHAFMASQSGRQRRDWSRR